VKTTTYINKNRPFGATIWHLLTVGFMLIMSGCASQVKNLPEQTKVDIPEKWEISIKERKKSDDKKVDDADQSKAVVKNGWLETFNDASLNKFVDVALNNNPDLLSSATQLKTAIEQVNIDGSTLWPNVSADLTSNRSDNKTSGVTTEIRTVTGALAISWEADIWGKLSQRKKSATFSALAQGEIYNAAELSLVANVSRAWYNLITNKLQVDLAQQRLDSFKRTAALIDENYKRGLRSALDVYLSRTDVQLQISSLSDTQFNYVQSLRAFKTLLGEYPDTNLEFGSSLPELENDIPLGLPAELLTRRPDLKASQLQYQAEIANAKAANRNRYPSISFNGTIGDSREKFNQLFENNTLVLTLVSGISQPIFQSGELKSREKQAIYQAENAYATLLKSTLSAFEEVENSISRESFLQEQHTALKEAVSFAQGGLELALDRYQSGLVNYTTVLESQRRLFDSKRNEINLRNALLQNRIGLHLALGGDFIDNPDRDSTKNLPSVINADANSNVQATK